MNNKYLKNVVSLEYNSDKCTGCGICVDVCPHAVFRMENRKAVITDRDLCMECGACEKNCPFSALSVRSGVGCAWAIMMSELKGKDEISCGCGE
jgi:NAD-dependent dihydropyrimidine dehydrogenase PreA subunit